MAIIGAHMLFYTPEPEALRAMLRDVFGFKAVDAGGGWLIFKLPPAELGVHPADDASVNLGLHHQISFMCDNIAKSMAQLRTKGVQFEGQPEHQEWGSRVMMNLPGGLKVMLYEPRHAMAIAPAKSKVPKQRAHSPRRRSTKRHR